MAGRVQRTQSPPFEGAERITLRASLPDAVWLLAQWMTETGNTTKFHVVDVARTAPRMVYHEVMLCGFQVEPGDPGTQFEAWMAGEIPGHAVWDGLCKLCRMSLDRQEGEDGGWAI